MTFILVYIISLVLHPVYEFISMLSLILNDNNIVYTNHFNTTTHGHNLLSMHILFTLWLTIFFFIFTTIRSTLPRGRIDIFLDFLWKYIITYMFILYLILIIIYV